MSEGWIKLHRKIMESQIWCNPIGLKIWVWILLKANHSEKPNWVNMSTGRGTTTIRVFQGQFIYGRKSAAKELKLPESTVRNWIKKLEDFGMILGQPKGHYTIIQVNNWEQYQVFGKDKQRTSKGQAKDTNNNYNNEKNVKKTQELKDLSLKGGGGAEVGAFLVGAPSPPPPVEEKRVRPEPLAYGSSISEKELDSLDFEVSVIKEDDDSLFT